jgi:hypothetical protein
LPVSAGAVTDGAANPAPDAAVAVAAPCALRLTASAFPVTAARVGPSPGGAGWAVAKALPPKETATAVEHRQPSADQPRAVLT